MQVQACTPLIAFQSQSDQCESLCFYNKDTDPKDPVKQTSRRSEEDGKIAMQNCKKQTVLVQAHSSAIGKPFL